MGPQVRVSSAFVRLGIVAALGAATTLAAQAAELERSHITLPEAISVNLTTGTVTLPLFHGHVGTKDVYYIITEASSKTVAVELGANYAPSITATYLQEGKGDTKSLTFEGMPDFKPARVYTNGTTGFPPRAAKPGAVGDAHYSPFVKIAGGTVLNAPIVATGDARDVVTHADTADRVVAIAPDKKAVTILLAHGFFDGSHVVYLSTEASDPGVAAIERATYVKGLDASKASSESPIVTFANGQTGANNPQAQGLAHVALDGNLSRNATNANVASDGSPLNVIATFNSGPAAAAYTPLWSGNVGLWSKAAVAAHENGQLKSFSAVSADAANGEITAPDGKAFGPSGFVVNCPVVGYVDKAP
jgi:hypothetical protein